MLMTITYLLAGIAWGLVLLCLVKYLTDNGRFWLNNTGPHHQVLDRNAWGGLQRSRNPQTAMRPNTNSPLLHAGWIFYLDKAPPSFDWFFCSSYPYDGCVLIKDSPTCAPKVNFDKSPLCPPPADVLDNGPPCCLAPGCYHRAAVGSQFCVAHRKKVALLSIKDSPEIVVSESEGCQVLDKVEGG